MSRHDRLEDSPVGQLRRLPVARSLLSYTVGRSIPCGSGVSAERSGSRAAGSTLVSPRALRQDVGVRDSALGARIVPANKASWDDLEAILAGASCHGGRCYCQRFKLHGTAWPGDALDHARMLREQTDCGHPKSAMTSGLVAYLDGEPAGWCNVEPRTAYPYFRSVPWRKRNEDRSDASIWAVPCFITRSGSVTAASATRLHAPPWTSHASAEPVSWRAIR